MTLNFGDLLSNALHDIKLHTRKKIGIVQDEIGYTFDPHLTGDTVESWRYRKGPSTLELLEQLAAAIMGYGCKEHDREWLEKFLKEGQHPYVGVVCDRHFPPQTDADVVQNVKTKFSPPPIAAYAPPRLEQFVGRAVELKRFRASFAQHNLALICGMAGIGKTTLATKLASEQPDQSAVFWHTFHDSNLQPFIRRIAGFLANHGQSDLWEMIELARQEGGKPPETETCLDTITAQLKALNVTLCLDDLQYVDDDPAFGEFLSKLQANQVQLIISARRFPSFLSASQLEIAGLSAADVSAFLTTRGIMLPADQVAGLHRSTGGNGAFLTLAAVVLKHANDPIDIISKLATVDSIERFLMEEVNDRLSANQQRVMEGVAVLGGYPGTRDVLEDMLNQRDVRRTLQELTGQFLLITSEGDYGREYHQHSIIQTFYYDQPRHRTRRELHLRAAEFYETEELDQFKATFHYVKGKNGGRATQIVTKYLWQIVNQGMARPLAKLLDEIPEAVLTQSDQFELWLAQGQLDTLFGDFGNGQEVLQKAADKLQELPKSQETDLLKGRVCLHMAELFERQSPPDALKWGVRGLDITSKTEIDLIHRLSLIIGTANLHIGNFGAALEMFSDLEEQQELLPDHLQISLQSNMAATQWNMGDLKEAKRYIDDALQKSIASRDHRMTARILINAGPIKYLSGDWQGAISDLSHGLDLAYRLGNSTSVTAISINLGSCHLNTGELDQAEELLTEGLKQAAGTHIQMETTALIRLAEIANIKGETESAWAMIDRAEVLAEKHNDQPSLTLIYAVKASILHQQGLLNDAQKAAEQSVSLSSALGDKVTLAIAQRELGKILRTRGNDVEAGKLFTQSIRILENNGDHQAAISHIEQAINLRMSQNHDFAREHLIEAEAICSALGAQRELDLIQLEFERLNSVSSHIS